MAKHTPIHMRPILNQAIYYIRKELHLTQEQAAILMKMRPDTFSKKERLGNLKMAWVEEFAEAVNIDKSIFSYVLSGNVTNEFFKTEAWKKLVNSSRKTTNLKAKYPDNVLESFYGPKGNDDIFEPDFENPTTEETITQIVEAANNSKLKSVLLDPTECCLINIFRDYSKQNRTKLINYANILKDEE